MCRVSSASLPRSRPQVVRGWADDLSVNDIQILEYLLLNNPWLIGVVDGLHWTLLVRWPMEEDERREYAYKLADITRRLRDEIPDAMLVLECSKGTLVVNLEAREEAV